VTRAVFLRFVVVGLTLKIQVLQLNNWHDFASKLPHSYRTFGETMGIRDKMRLAIETSISLKTIDKWLKGARVNEANQRALERAVKALGITAYVDAKNKKSR
jgi:hypothetical protein